MGGVFSPGQLSNLVLDDVDLANATVVLEAGGASSSSRVASMGNVACPRLFDIQKRKEAGDYTIGLFSSAAECRAWLSVSRVPKGATIACTADADLVMTVEPTGLSETGLILVIAAAGALLTIALSLASWFFIMTRPLSPLSSDNSLNARLILI